MQENANKYNTKVATAIINLETTLGKLDALYSLFSEEYIHNTIERMNMARIESRSAIGCILYDLITQAQNDAEVLIALLYPNGDIKNKCSKSTTSK